MSKYTGKGARALAIVMGLGAGLGVDVHAQSSGEKLPFYVSASETVTRDSNFSRTDKAQAETIFSTAALAGLYKSYGRQQYNLSAQYAINRYQNYKELLNNNSKYLSGSFSTDLLANWEATVGGSYSQNLNPIKDNVNAERVVKNIRTYNDRYASLRYGLDGYWSITGTASANTVRYSRDAYKGLNADQRSTSLRVNYYPVGNVSLGLAYRPASTHYVNSASDRTITDHNIDYSFSWQVTGLSSFSAQYTRKRSKYSDDDLRSNRTWSGNLGWSYTPGGIWSYGFNASRYNSTDRLNTLFADASGGLLTDAFGRTDTLLGSTAYSANVGAALTGKVSLRASYGINKNRYNFSQIYRNLDQCFTVLGTQLGYCDAVRDVKSIQHTAGLTLAYQPTRSVGTQCNLLVYSQTRDRYGIRYQGRSVDCTVKVTLDSLSPLFDSWFE